MEENELANYHAELNLVKGLPWEALSSIERITKLKSKAEENVAALSTFVQLHGQIADALMAGDASMVKITVARGSFNSKTDIEFFSHDKEFVRLVLKAKYEELGQRIIALLEETRDMRPAIKELEEVAKRLVPPVIG